MMPSGTRLATSFRFPVSMKSFMVVLPARPKALGQVP
jgi:hypothetical protein